MNPRPRAVLTSTFPLSGAVTTVLGPLLPLLIPHWSLSDAAAGRLFVAQFLASTAAAAASGSMAARFGISRSIAAAYAVMGAALIALGQLSYWPGLICIGCYGAALGVSIPLVNGLAAAGAAGREVESLNLLNTAWCAGAIVSPPVVVVLARTLSLGAVTGLLGVLCLGAAAACLAWLAPAVNSPSAPSDGASAVERSAVMTGVFAFLYIGVENAVNGWLPTLAQRDTGAESVASVVPLSIFWASILLSRLAAAFAASRITPSRTLLLGLCIAIPGVALILAQHPVLLVIGAGAAGLGLGPIFPTAIAMFQKSQRGASARLLGLIFAVSGCGGAVTPWLVGVVSSATGSLRYGMLLALASAVVMVVFPKRLDTTLQTY